MYAIYYVTKLFVVYFVEGAENDNSHHGMNISQGEVTVLCCYTYAYMCVGVRTHTHTHTHINSE